MAAIPDEHDETQLLNVLQQQGKKFMESFSLSEPSSKRRKVARSEMSDEEEEWLGITSPIADSVVSYSPEDNFEKEKSDMSSSNEDQFDDEVSAESSLKAVRRLPEVVVFDGKYFIPSSSIPKAQINAFMSSKVAKLSKDIPVSNLTSWLDGDEEERSNYENDALLHRLVHTKLLSGSRETKLNMVPAERKRALEGRIMELSGGAKLGKGEGTIKRGERGKAAKRVRDGIEAKEKQVTKLKLDEAKNLGNYHPTIKRLFEPSISTKPAKKRERGLRMGVGKFSGSVLKLGNDEITIAQGQRSRGPRERSRHRR